MTVTFVFMGNTFCTLIGLLLFIMQTCFGVGLQLKEGIIT